MKHAGTGIRWKIMTTLNELDFADDLALISRTFTHIRMKINHLNRNGKGMSLKSSTKKTKLMRINAKNNNAIVAK